MQPFVELPALGLGATVDSSPFAPFGTGRTGVDCQLIVEGSAGVRLSVLLARADVAVIDAVCRNVLREIGFAAPRAT